MIKTPRRAKCHVENKDIYVTKEEAAADIAEFRRNHNGRGKSYRCSFGDHYHVTKGLRGNKGKGTR